ncbi:hypothetical protein N8I74_06380 [Chitiniphilus purpureus]|uniref:Uncharacterized protein n=1 Tax=Chitiniphilus purpureus TaxID=2981137 RepID=A0ABY6DQQ2_9NEIS|nr:hypothetical protein [Chitiniphilus sp. CD1]UXY16642.1 hypothetical protein N8I74_06380 [Chitiniphilus sp. CD1]
MNEFMAQALAKALEARQRIVASPDEGLLARLEAEAHQARRQRVADGLLVTPAEIADIRGVPFGPTPSQQRPSQCFFGDFSALATFREGGRGVSRY